MDQVGRASIIHYTRRLQTWKSSNLGISEFHNSVLRLLLKVSCLFSEDVREITEKCSVQKAVAKCLSSSKPKQVSLKENSKTKPNPRKEPGMKGSGISCSSKGSLKEVLPEETLRMGSAS